jgi:hypothetical protein
MAGAMSAYGPGCVKTQYRALEIVFTSERIAIKASSRVEDR